MKFFKIALSALFVVTPFLPLFLDSSKALFFRDLGRHHFPLRAFWHQSVTKFFELPLWNNFLMGGEPAWADIEYSTLYPLNFIYLFFTTENLVLANSFFVAANVLLIFGATYYLLRTVRLKKMDAVLFSVCFSWSGAVISCFNVINILGSMVAVPFFFACLINFLRKKEFIYLCLMSLGIAWPVYAGDPQFSYLLALIASLILIKKQKLSGCVNVVKIAMLSIFASAPQLLPSFIQVLESSRPFSVRNFATAEIYSFHPLRISEYFFSVPFGAFAPINNYNFPPIANHQAFILSFYLGALVLFSLFSYFLVWSKKSFGPKIILYSLAAACVFFYLSLGRYEPIHINYWLYKYFPGWSVFRYPQRLGLWTSFFVLFSAALMWKRFSLWLALHKNNHSNKISLLLTSPLLVYFLVFALFVLMKAITNTKGIQFDLVILGCISIVLILKRKMSSRIPFIALLFALVLFDQGFFLKRMLWEQPTSIISNQPLANWIQKDLAKREEELKRGASRRYTSAFLDVWSFNRTHVPKNLNTVGQVTWDIYRKIAPNSSILYQIEDAASYGSLAPKSRKEHWEQLNRQAAKLLGLLGIYYTPQKAKNGLITPNTFPDALPYLFFPTSLKSAQNFQDALANIVDSNFDWKKTSIVENIKLQSPERFSRAVEILERTPSKIKIKVSPGQNAFLVWNESFDKNWTSSVNQTDTKVFRNNAWSIGIDLPQADSEQIVVFRYRNIWILIGCSMFILWLILFNFTLYKAYRGKNTC